MGIGILTLRWFATKKNARQAGVESVSNFATGFVSGEFPRSQVVTLILLPPLTSGYCRTGSVEAGHAYRLQYLPISDWKPVRKSRQGRPGRRLLFRQPPLFLWIVPGASKPRSAVEQHEIQSEFMSRGEVQVLYCRLRSHLILTYAVVFIYLVPGAPVTAPSAPPRQRLRPPMAL